MRNYTTPLAVAAILLIVGTSAPSATRISGELKTWHKVTLTFDGPEVSEEDEQNPFTDYRLNVTFSKDNKTYRVPGYFAADGDAANTEADSGNKWRDRELGLRGLLPKGPQCGRQRRSPGGSQRGLHGW